MILGSLLQVPETQSAFHWRAQRNAFRRRDPHLQSSLRAAVAAGADRGPLKTRRKIELHFLVPVPALRGFDLQQIWLAIYGLFLP